jgi:hypothetical protein
MTVMTWFLAAAGSLRLLSQRFARSYGQLAAAFFAL